jgi:hypothetical protein
VTDRGGAALPSSAARLPPAAAQACCLALRLRNTDDMMISYDASLVRHPWWVGYEARSHLRCALRMHTVALAGWLAAR